MLEQPESRWWGSVLLWFVKIIGGQIDQSMSGCDPKKDISAKL
jgi:hypothetical protein